MSRKEAVPLTIKIMGREYQVSCPPDERDGLLASARYLDERMQSIRRRSASLGIERIAVMAALNMARELLESGSARDKDKRTADEPDERIEQLTLQIETELQNG